MFPTISIFNIAIPTYFVIQSLAVIICLIWIYWETQKSHLESDHIWNLSLILMITGLLGARLFHILYEYPSLYLDQPSRVFFVWEGGFVFLGGALCAALSGYYYLWLKKVVSKWDYFDFFTPVVSLGYLLGRLGCLMAGCCYGKICTLPWAMFFHTDDIAVARHPTQLYYILWELIIFCILLLLKKQPWLKQKKSGSLFWIWLSVHSLGRFWIEFFRDDFRGPQWGFSISAWISLVLLTISSWQIFRLKKT